jgi:hypothetical protein
MIRTLLANGSTFVAQGRQAFWSVNWTLLALRTLNLIYTAVQKGVWVSKKTYAAVTDAFSEDVYLFFKGDSSPYHVRHVIQDGPGIASLAWTFNKNTKTFTSSNAAPTTHAKYLEWLSASIQYNGLNLYSLDDVIEGTKYVDANGVMPSNDILVAAWSLSSGVVLDKTIDLKLFIIHSDGREETTSLWNQFQQKVEPKKEESKKTEPKNEFLFPSAILSPNSNLAMAVNERLISRAYVQDLVQRTTTGTIDDVSGNSEIPATNGIAEVDFEKVD